MTLHELIEVLPSHRTLLLSEVLVRSEVVHPQRLGPRLVWPGRLLVEEENVRLHPARVEESGRQAQQGMHVKFGEQSPPYRLPSATFEQDVVRQDQGPTTVDVKDRLDVLGNFSCLFAVVTQKSSLAISSSSFDSRPSAPIMVTDDLRPNGGFARTTE